LIVVTLALLLTSCSRPPEEALHRPEKPIVWPPAPALPRIQFIRAFSRPQDLGIKEGFFRQLRNLFAGPTALQLVRPMAVVATSNGALYVADPGSQGIYRFDLTQGRCELIRGKGGEPLPSPVGLTAGPEGEVYVADSLLGQLFIITPNSKVATPVPLSAQMGQPTTIALDPAAGQLYIVDTADHQVKVFGLDGTLRSTFGRRGTSDGEFNYPVAIWRDSAGHIFVTDTMNFRIQVFDGDGRFLGKLGQLGDATGDLSRPKGVATDRFGHIYVVDALFHVVQVFNLAGDFLLAFGSQGQGPGEFWLPTGIFIGEHDTIYVADSHNQRIQVFRYVGGQP
jgi:DNA-binding beta-propeller fold protein YncE